MTQKKTFEEAQVEIIKFECKDIITTSALGNNDWENKGQVNYGLGGKTKGFERDI